MKKIEVVAAVIEKDGLILATQRGYGEFKGKWEFPGGKIKNGETHEEALKREIKEELDIEVKVKDFILTVDYDYLDFHLTMSTYYANIVEGEISLLEHMDMKWLKKEELEKVDWIDADIEIIKSINTLNNKEKLNSMFNEEVNFYYETKNEKLILGDCFEILENIKKESIDMIFVDPPYFLSNGGISCSSGKMVSVNKGKWDKYIDINKKHEFNKKWIKLCKKCLKDNGTIWVSGTFHNIYSVGMALEEEGFKIINNITWQKTNPPPNLSCKCFTHSTETILWAKKDNSSKYTFNYKLMKEKNGGKQMKDVWSGSLTKPTEKKEGKHPTQKPEYLLEKIILASTNENDIILDPFSGSGTAGVVSKKYNRKYIGIEVDKTYIQIAKTRIKNQNKDIIKK